MLPRLLIIAAATLFLQGCGSGYAPGSSAADFPADIKLIRLIGVEPVVVETRQPAPRDLSDPRSAPGETVAVSNQGATENTRAVIATFKAALIAQFGKHGIRIAEGDAAGTPDLAVHVSIEYQPELGLYIHRYLIAEMSIQTPAGREIRHERYQNSNQFLGVLASMVESSSEMATTSARELVDRVVAEMRKARRALGPAGAASLAQQH